MLDFDPRDHDSRNDERHGTTPTRGNRGGSDDRERNDDWSQADIRLRDRDDGAARTLGRGPPAIGRPPMSKRGITVMTHAGWNATAIVASAT